VDDLVDLEALGRKEAGAVHRLFAHEHGRDHGREAGRDRAVERPAVERERQARGVADDVAEPRAGEPRAALHLEAAELEVLLGLVQLRDLADLAHDLALGVPARLLRDRLVRGVRHFLQQLVAMRLGLAQLLLQPAQVLLDRLQLLDLLRRRLALQLLAPAQLVDLRHELAPALVRRQQLVERLGATFSRVPRPHAVGICPRGFEVDQPCFWVRYATRSAICLSDSVWPKLGIAFASPFSMSQLGLAIDSCVKSCSVPWLAVFAYAASLSRSGPTVP